ncbi:uncharacterized protein LOC123685111 isoform X2 [Harmonia axyridis]|uniref:uncharacterized protein LOC123685111 isoform X2 n=1 Tax=Harmonia axyridis TaxID=115357 RepID=UPI001E27823A|nr:uncharacterized protein LOC123685111 isoform X2 [Harmonia axyridis]
MIAATRMISTIVILSLLGSSVGLQDDIQGAHLQNDIQFQNHQNQQYLVQQRAVPQQYPQHYVPVPIQLLQRSVYTQQPQAALIIVKAFPVYLTPDQAANIQRQAPSVHQDGSGISNVQMIHYNVAASPTVYPIHQSYQSHSAEQSVPVYSTAQPAAEKPSSVSTHYQVNNKHLVATERPASLASHYQANNQLVASNSGLFYAPPSSVQGDSYLNQLAQVVAQQYSKSPTNFKAPAIIAGLENFSAEQQNQIKNHLKNYISQHGEDGKQDKDSFEHREISATNESHQKYSSKIPTTQYSQQSDWRPAHQPTAVTSKH